MSNLLLLSLLMVGGITAFPEVEISSGQRLYTGYKVLRTFPQTNQQRTALLQLEDGRWYSTGCLTNGV